jgi:1-acyl-sn-glycerol-3-phosphate acyltransferase
VNQLRATFRLGAFLLWCVAAFLVALAVQLLIVLAPSVGIRAKRVVARTWARGICRIIGLRVEVQGNPPAPPFILVSNHLSYVDIVTLMSVLPGVFVAKSEVAHWPLLGQLSRVANTIFVDRQSKKDVVRVNVGIDKALARGEGLIMFPEGTSSRGRDVLPFRSSLLQPAVSSGHPVSYASISYRTPAGSPPAEMSVCWWGDMTFGRHFWELLQLPGIDGSVSFGSRTLLAESRHELARSLQSAVSESFQPVSDAPTSATATTIADPD